MKKLLIVSLILFISSCSLNSVKENIDSPNFKDGIFHNLDPNKNRKKGFFRFLSMRLTTDWSDWPDWVSTDEVDNLNSRESSEKIKVSWINHSTFLIQTQGLNIITDPIFSERASPVSFAGPKRVHKPAISLANLPKIDIVIISHDHYDHLDLDSINTIIKRDNPKVYLGLGVKKRLENQSNIIELDWWQSRKFNEITTIHFVPVQHFSGRTLSDRNSTLWGGFVLEVGGRKIYFGGDTGYGNHFKQVFNEFGEMDVSFLPIGAYAPRSFMKYMHMNPEDAVKAHNDLNSKKSIGMHFETFQMTAEPRDEPRNILSDVLKKYQINDGNFISPILGQTLTF